MEEPNRQTAGGRCRAGQHLGCMSCAALLWGMVWRGPVDSHCRLGSDSTQSLDEGLWVRHVGLPLQTDIRRWGKGAQPLFVSGLSIRAARTRCLSGGCPPRRLTRARAHVHRPTRTRVSGRKPEPKRPVDGAAGGSRSGAQGAPVAKHLVTSMNHGSVRKFMRRGAVLAQSDGQAQSACSHRVESFATLCAYTPPLLHGAARPEKRDLTVHAAAASRVQGIPPGGVSQTPPSHRGNGADGDTRRRARDVC